MSGSLSPTSLDRTARAVLRTALRRPGGLYQPLLVGPVSGRDVLDADVDAIAATEDLPVVRGLAEARQAIERRLPAVALLSVGDAEALLAGGVPPVGVQVVLWAAEAEAVSAAVREWVSGGVAIPPAVDGVQGENFLAATLARCARERGRRYNPVFVLSGAAGAAFAAQESHLRLEMAGVEPVVTLEAGNDTLAAGLKSSRAGAVVLTLPPEAATAGGGAIARALKEAIGRGLQVVAITDPRSHELLGHRAEWAELVHQGVALSAPAYPEAANGGEPEGLPEDGIDAAELLVGAPAVGAAPRVAFKGDLSGLPLADVLQTLAMGRTGTLVVHAAEQVGWIRLQQGRVVAARDYSDVRDFPALAAARGVEGAPQAAAALADGLVEERVCRIGAWSGASFAFLQDPLSGAGDDDAVASLDPSGLAMEIARRLDESERRAAKVGGLTRIWARSGEGPADTGTSSVRRLWLALDGRRSLAQAATAAGLLHEEAFGAIRALVAEGFAKAAGEADEAPAGLPVQEVVRHLLAWGLLAEGREVLRGARGKKVTPEAALLVGYLEGLGDPKVGFAYYRAAADRLSGVDTSRPRVARLLLIARLNAALLGYRAGELAARDAWAMAKAEVDAGRLKHADSPRFTALLATLARAAGDEAAASQAVERLRSLEGPEAASLLDRIAD